MACGGGVVWVFYRYCCQSSSARRVEVIRARGGAHHQQRRSTSRWIHAVVDEKRDSLSMGGFGVIFSDTWCHMTGILPRSCTKLV